MFKNKKTKLKYCSLFLLLAFFAYAFNFPIQKNAQVLGPVKAIAKQTESIVTTVSNVKVVELASESAQTKKVEVIKNQNCTFSPYSNQSQNSLVDFLQNGLNNYFLNFSSKCSPEIAVQPTKVPVLSSIVLTAPQVYSSVVVSVFRNESISENRIFKASESATREDFILNSSLIVFILLSLGLSILKKVDTREVHSVLLTIFNKPDLAFLKVRLC